MDGHVPDRCCVCIHGDNCKSMCRWMFLLVVNSSPHGPHPPSATTLAPFRHTRACATSDDSEVQYKHWPHGVPLILQRIWSICPFPDCHLLSTNVGQMRNVVTSIVCEMPSLGEWSFYFSSTRLCQNQHQRCSTCSVFFLSPATKKQRFHL